MSGAPLGQYTKREQVDGPQKIDHDTGKPIPETYGRLVNDIQEILEWRLGQLNLSPDDILSAEAAIWGDGVKYSKEEVTGSSLPIRLFACFAASLAPSCLSLILNFPLFHTPFYPLQPFSFVSGFSWISMSMLKKVRMWILLPSSSATTSTRRSSQSGGL